MRRLVFYGAAGRVAETEELADFVKGLACCVVNGLTEALIAPEIHYFIYRRMPARYDQGEKRRANVRMFAGEFQGHARVS